MKNVSQKMAGLTKLDGRKFSKIHPPSKLSSASPSRILLMRMIVMKRTLKWEVILIYHSTLLYRRTSFSLKSVSQSSIRAKKSMILRIMDIWFPGAAHIKI